MDDTKKDFLWYFLDYETFWFNDHLAHEKNTIWCDAPCALSKLNEYYKDLIEA